MRVREIVATRPSPIAPAALGALTAATTQTQMYGRMTLAICPRLRSGSRSRTGPRSCFQLWRGGRSAVFTASILFPTTHRGQDRISSEGGRELREVVEGARIRQRVAAGRALRGLSHQDPLDRDLEDLPAQRAGHLGDLEDLVGDVARRALLADAALDLGLQVV